MNVEVSRRVARAQYILRDEVGPPERARMIEACEAADSYASLPVWLRDFVERGERAAGDVAARAS